MTLEDIPTVLTVRQLSQALGMSESWLYDQWKKGNGDLPKPFKIGRSTRILGEDAVSFLKKRAGINGEVQA